MREIRAVEGKAGFADFLDVPSLLYEGDPHYIEQLRFERSEHLGHKNPYFQHARHRYFVAYAEDGRPSGRISAQIDTLEQKDGAPKIGHFGLIEGVDMATLQALLAAAETWLKSEGVASVTGPFSLSINDESGLLVEGFDSAPRLLMNYAPAWYGPAIEAAGYAKAKDLIAYTLDCQKPLPKFGAQMAERAAALPEVTERSMKPGKAAEEMATILEIFNDAWSDNWGFVPITAAEGDYMVKNLKPVLIPALARIVEIDGAPAGMAVCLPDVNEALPGLGGKLLPFGWAKLLWRLKVKKVPSGRVLLMGVKKQYRDGPIGAAVAVLVIARLYEACARAGLRHLEMSWVLEDNEPVNRVGQLVGGTAYKRYRVYGKSL